MKRPPKTFEFDELYIDLTSDWGFKYILGSSENKEFTLSFINSILPKEDYVNDVQFLATEHLGQEIEARVAVFDILCTTEDNRKILIEMQKLPQYYFPDRTLFYSTWPIQSQAVKGEWDYRLNKVYIISVIGFKLKTSTNHFINHHKILNTETLKEYTQALEFITIELPRFKLKLDETKTLIEKWIWAFIYLNKVRDQAPEFIENTFNRLLEKADLLKFNKKTLNEYKVAIFNERNLKPFTDYIRDEALAEGERKAKQEMAQKLLAKGLSKTEVEELTGLQLD